VTTLNNPSAASNPVKSALQRGDLVLGTWILMVRTPSVVRLAATAGLDFVLIDTQHSSFTLETVADMCELARACGIVPIVRVTDRSPEHGNRIQDVGALGLMFSDITARSEIDRIRSWMAYPPDGTRGHTASGAATDYQPADAAMKHHIDDQMMMVVQIESRRGVDRVDELLIGGGIDVVEIGAGDLSTDLGVPGEVRHPLVLDAVETVTAACARHGVPVGIGCTSPQDGAEMLGRGVRMLTFSNDRQILLRAWSDAANGIRGALGANRPPR
jgi:2-keto-3-deoxy-L-rhamnonate aldolase RhmA